MIRKDLSLHKQGALDVSQQLFKIFQFEAWSKLEQNYRKAAIAPADHSNGLPVSVRR